MRSNQVILVVVALLVFGGSLFAMRYFALQAGREKERKENALTLMEIAQYERDSLIVSLEKAVLAIGETDPKVLELIESVDQLRQETVQALNNQPERETFDGTDDALAVLADSLYRQRARSIN